MSKKDYRDLEVWQLAMNLVVECYRLTTAFPKSELYGLASQLRRAAVSVPANIAEGQARQHVKEFVQHLSIAQGSLAEAETHVQIAERLHYINDDQVQDILARTDRVARMITGLKKSLQDKKPTTRN
jgi:four helix bundle protein